MTTQRPTRNDAADYYFTYIDKVPDGDVVEHLKSQISETQALLEAVADERGSFRYEPDKWSLNQVIGHMADAERVFAYRALAFSRGDEQAIPGMDQDSWAEAGGFDDQPFSAVAADFVAARSASLTLFANMTPRQWLRRGTASDVEFQVGAIAWIIAGHELHHRGVLIDRYRVGS